MSSIGEKLELEHINTPNKSTVIKTGQTSNTAIFNIKDSNTTPDPIDVENKPQAEPETNTTSPAKRSINQLNDWLKNICKQYGLNETEVLEAGILEKISGYNTQQLENIDEKEINRIKKSLIAAIQDTSAINGQKDLTAITDLAKDYNLAQLGDWSIEGFKENNQKNSDSISQRMNSFFGIKNFSALSPEEKSHYLERYFGKWYKGKEISALSDEEKNKIYKLQRQDFAKMIINTDDKNKEDVWTAVEFLLSKNKVPGLEAVIRSYDSSKLKTLHADKQGAKLIEGLNKIDDFGLYVSKSDVTKGTMFIAEIQSEEGRKTTHEKLSSNIKLFFEENKEILKSIEEKEKNPNAKYTEEEQEIKRQRDEYYTAVAAGEIIGTAQNKIISEGFRSSHMESLVTDAKDISQENYIRVMNNVSSYVKENSNQLSVSEKEINEQINKVTNNEYSKIVSENATPNKKNETKQETINTTNEVVTTKIESQTNFSTNPIKSYDVLRNGTEEEVAEYVQKTISDSDKSGINAKEQEFKRQNAIKLLNQLIESNMIQNSKYESLVLKQLASTSVPTLLNIFLSSSDKTKEYFFKNHLVTPLTIAMNTPTSVIEQLPDNIKEKVLEFKK